MYLAEVLKKTRVIGSGKAELKLLACQRSEQCWSVVSGEEIIPAPDDASSYNAGTLVMLDLTANRQVQRHSEASRQLISILQNFSRLQEKAKTQEEEIEQWKQSLTYQSQELNRREMEMEARQEQLQQMEEDFERLEQQRQEINTAQLDVDRLREEFDRKNQELEGAWAQLHGELSRLDERQAELQQSNALDDEQARYLNELLNRLAGVVTPTTFVREQLDLSFSLFGQQNERLNHCWQDLEQKQSTVYQLQADIDRQGQDLQNRWQEWQQAQDALEQARAELKAEQRALESKQNHALVLTQHIQHQDTLYQRVYGLADVSDRVRIGAKVDLGALEQMPLDELQKLAQDLENDLEKMSRFVASQEEELSLQQDAIDELNQQIQQASEYDRLRLETERADEQDRYQMLNQTLVGQRRNLQEREAILRQHQAVLARRQGFPRSDAVESDIDLEPVLSQIETLKQQYAQELQRAEAEIQQLKDTIEQMASLVERQHQEQDEKRNEIKQIEQEWQSQKAATSEMWGRVNTYQEMLQPTQDGLNELKLKSEAIASVMTQFQEAIDYQQETIAEMQQAIQRLVGEPMPELAAS
nr:pilus motility taxis protein HmpF [Oculatella sp. LEGE 06141]